MNSSSYTQWGTQLSVFCHIINVDRYFQNAGNSLSQGFSSIKREFSSSKRKDIPYNQVWLCEHFGKCQCLSTLPGGKLLHQVSLKTFLSHTRTQTKKRKVKNFPCGTPRFQLYFTRKVVCQNVLRSLTLDYKQQSAGIYSWVFFVYVPSYISQTTDGLWLFLTCPQVKSSHFPRLWVVSPMASRWPQHSVRSELTHTQQAVVNISSWSLCHIAKRIQDLWESWYI